MQIFFTLNRYLLVLFWLLFCVNLVQPLSPPWHNWVLYAGLFLLAAHLLELMMIGKRLQKINRLQPKDIFWVLLIGLFHWVPLLRKPQ